MNYEELREWIEEERVRQGLSVESLAHNVGMTLNSMGRFLRGEMELKAANLFATVAALGYDLKPVRAKK